MVTLIVACLMVSRIRYPHLVNQLFHGRHNFQHLVKLLFALGAVLAVHELAIPLVFLYFVVSSPLRALWVRVVLRRARWPARSGHASCRVSTGQAPNVAWRSPPSRTAIAAVLGVDVLAARRLPAMDGDHVIPFCSD